MRRGHTSLPAWVTDSPFARALAPGALSGCPHVSPHLHRRRTARTRVLGRAGPPLHLGDPVPALGQNSGRPASQTGLGKPRLWLRCPPSCRLALGSSTPLPFGPLSRECSRVPCPPSASGPRLPGYRGEMLGRPDFFPGSPLLLSSGPMYPSPRPGSFASSRGQSTVRSVTSLCLWRPHLLSPLLTLGSRAPGQLPRPGVLGSARLPAMGLGAGRPRECPLSGGLTSLLTFSGPSTASARDGHSPKGRANGRKRHLVEFQLD